MNAPFIDDRIFQALNVVCEGCGSRFVFGPSASDRLEQLRECGWKTSNNPFAAWCSDACRSRYDPAIRRKIADFLRFTGSGPVGHAPNNFQRRYIEAGEDLPEPPFDDPIGVD
jgi:hypothetical protein